MNDNLNNYKTFPSGKLELVRNTIDRDLTLLEKKIDSLEETKNEIKDKILLNDQIANRKAESKNGKKTFDDDKWGTILLLSYYPFCCFISYKYIDGFDSIVGAIVIGFVLMIFTMPLLSFFLAIITGITFTFFGHSLIKKDEVNKKKFNKYFNSEKRKLYKGETSEKNLYKKIKTLETQISKLDNKYYFYEALKKDLPSLIRRARQREKTAKIAAFDKKTRDASDIVRKDLVKAVKNKSNWKCPYCNTKKDFKFHETDHIHPVSKGGMAVPENMIPICKECNQNKKALTLRVFSKKFGYNFEKICERLEMQGKDI